MDLCAQMRNPLMLSTALL